jgi:Flp pilus assembly protein TadG
MYRVFPRPLRYQEKQCTGLATINLSDGKQMTKIVRSQSLLKQSLFGRSRIVQVVHAEEGMAAVELALVAVLFLTFLFGSIDVCRAMYSYHFVSHAARAAARFAAVRGSNCAGLSGGCPASQADIQTFITGITPPGISTKAITVTANCGLIGNVNGGCSSPNNKPGNMVKVTVQYDYAFAFGFMPKGAIPMKAHSQLVISQ